MSRWVNTEDAQPTKDGHYWVWIMGDSEMDDCGGMMYEYGDYTVLMDITAEDDGPDNPPYITGIADHDEAWDLVCAWWDTPVEIPERK